jgi:cation transport ATPase
MIHSQTFPLTGLTCASCVEKVTNRLLRHTDITAATVTLSPPQAQISTRSPFSDESLNEWLQPLGKYRVQPATSDLSASSSASAAPSSPSPQINVKTYRPLLLLLAYLLLVIAAISISHGSFDLPLAMRLFMGGFFVTFSFFKLLDLRGFADAYRSYDLVAKAWPPYGHLYPFIELSLGLAYLMNLCPLWVNAITALVMAVSLAGVLRAVISRRAIRCACLGTVFQLPMSTVTIIEDALMLLMALSSFLHA